MARSERPAPFTSAGAVQQAFDRENYIVDPSLALTLLLATELEKPVLLEGEAGVGKTDVACVLARVLDTELVRLQCYEGLDVSTSLYEWNYAKQILRIRMAEAGREEPEAVQRTIFSDEFLLERPLLRAIRHEGLGSPVLLIDEVDRADEEFEAFLLEVLSDYQVTVPEIGTFRATQKPFVVLTSNRTRELNDALKRRCLYLWMDFPTADREREIVLRKVPGIRQALADQIVGVMQKLRALDLDKGPGIAETLDWGRALVSLAVDELDPRVVEKTAGCYLKSREDIERLQAVGGEALLAGDASEAT